MNIEQKINYYKWKALISFMGERNRKKKHVGEKKENKKNSCVWELSPFTLSQLSNTVYQRIELT